jgi:hypothetical protein
VRLTRASAGYPARVLRAARRLPFLKVLAIAQVALLVRRHLLALEPYERRRLAELVRRGRSLDPSEREELRGLIGKMEPGVFALTAADAFSPVRIPGARRRRRH